MVAHLRVDGSIGRSKSSYHIFKVSELVNEHSAEYRNHRFVCVSFRVAARSEKRCERTKRFIAIPQCLSPRSKPSLEPAVFDILLPARSDVPQREGSFQN